MNFYCFCTALCNVQLDEWFLIFFDSWQFLKCLVISQWFLSVKIKKSKKSKKNPKKQKNKKNSLSKEWQGMKRAKGNHATRILASAECCSWPKSDALLCVLKSLFFCICWQHPWSMVLGSVSLLYQYFISLPAGERKRLCGVKTSVIQIFSSNKSQGTLEPRSSPFACLHSWVI